MMTIFASSSHPLLLTEHAVNGLVEAPIMIMNFYSAKTIEKYSKALYIKIKFKFKIPKSYNYNNDMLCYGKN